MNHCIRFQCDIPASADISEVYFCHSGFEVVINPNVSVGKGTVIQHRATIGELDGNGCPKVGADCYIGAKATLLGNIHIGNNVKIGAGAVV